MEIPSWNFPLFVATIQNLHLKSDALLLPQTQQKVQQDFDQKRLIQISHVKMCKASDKKKESGNEHLPRCTYQDDP